MPQIDFSNTCPWCHGGAGISLTDSRFCIDHCIPDDWSKDGKQWSVMDGFFTIGCLIILSENASIETESS